MSDLNAQIPDGPIEEKWVRHRFNLKLVSPANKTKFTILVIGGGLAGSSAAATLGELGYNVKVFCLQDTPRRSHSIAAQGGINAAKNYPNDGDSVRRLFYDMMKGGDFRSREANVYRLAQVSNAVIDHCVAQGVPFAREYGGTLANRSFGGVQVSRTFYSRGLTGQQLLLGAYGSMMRQVSAGRVEILPRREMLDLVVADGRARGVVCRNLITGQMERYAGHAVLMCTGGYGNVFFLSTNSVSGNVTATWRAYKKGAWFANPCFTQIHPTCIPVGDRYQSKLTLMSESLRNDGRIWVPIRPGDSRLPSQIPESERDYFLERRYPTYGNLVPRDVASRAAKAVTDEGRGVGPTKIAVYLDFSAAIKRYGLTEIRRRYDNLFEMYQHITNENPYETPMRIFPAVHYAMGGLWVDYNLMSTIPGLFVLGEANFSDHGANRLGASALMQGLADGYFVLPPTLGGYLASQTWPAVGTDHAAFTDTELQAGERIRKILSVQGRRSAASFHQDLGKLLWDKCGMARNEGGLKEALAKIPAIREEFWKNVRVTETHEEFNQSLERAGRVADYLEFAEVLVRDALERKESCGSHFREEYQTPDNEPMRDDKHFSHVAAWQYKGDDRAPELHKEPLESEAAARIKRSYV